MQHDFRSRRDLKFKYIFTTGDRLHISLLVRYAFTYGIQSAVPGRMVEK